MDIKRKLQSFDYLLLILVCGLSLFGIIVIGSASHIYMAGALADEYERQKLWFITGLLMLVITSFVDYKFIAKFYWVGYVLNLALLLLVLSRGNQMTTGVRRELSLGPSWARIQPSEFAKLFMLIYVARFVDRFNEKLNFFPVLIGLLISIIVPVALILNQPSLSASMVVFSVSLVLIFIGGLQYRYIVGGFAIGLPVAYIFIADIFREPHLFVDKFLKEYHIQNRIIPFLNKELADPTDRYQVIQSMMAIGSGQLNGKGLYNGTLNQLSYVPYSHNDFIFAVIGEEFGFIGCVTVLAVIFLIVVKCILVAYKADSITGKLIAAGVAFMFAFQTFVNVGVATDTLPNTGMALPFVSYGGSSMWINMIAVGMVINVGMIKPKSLFEE